MSESSEQPLPISSTRTGSLATASPATVRQAREEARHWLALAERIGQQVDLDATAFEAGAFQRRRGVPTAGNLLALALMHGPGQLSLPRVVEHAQMFGIANLSEQALLRRLVHATSWLEIVAEQLLIEQLLARSSVGLRTDISEFKVALRPYESWRRAARTARHFIDDLMPWPANAFNEQQAHWLMCVRWTFVASSMRQGQSMPGCSTNGSSLVQRVRRTAHLIAALSPDATL